MSRAPSGYAVQRAMSDLMQARETLAQIDPAIAEDAKLFLDSLEGMTDGIELIDKLAEAAINTEITHKAVKEYATKLAERAARVERSAKWLRSQVLAMLQALDLPRLERPGYTATVQAGTPGVVITDETALAEEYVRIKREPRKDAIREALRAGQDVRGAELRNAEPHLRIRI